MHRAATSAGLKQSIVFMMLSPVTAVGWLSGPCLNAMVAM